MNSPHKRASNAKIISMSRHHVEETYTLLALYIQPLLISCCMKYRAIFVRIITRPVCIICGSHDVWWNTHDSDYQQAHVLVTPWWPLPRALYGSSNGVIRRLIRPQILRGCLQIWWLASALMWTLSLVDEEPSVEVSWYFKPRDLVKRVHLKNWLINDE